MVGWYDRYMYALLLLTSTLIVLNKIKNQLKRLKKITMEIYFDPCIKYPYIYTEFDWALENKYNW